MPEVLLDAGHPGTGDYTGHGVEGAPASDASG